jgi:hypothetical protein
MSSFILVFRHHQLPADAVAYQSEQEFTTAYDNGQFDKSCACSSWQRDENATYDEAIDDAGHDLHQLTRLDSAGEVHRYVDDRGYCGQHNKGISSVISAAKELGWWPEEDDSSAPSTAGDHAA